MLIIVLLLTAANWVLYHKIFHVVYFGGAIHQIVGEFLVAFIVAGLELGLIGTVLPAILPFAAIGAAVVGIVLLIKHFSGK